MIPYCFNHLITYKFLVYKCHAYINMHKRDRLSILLLKLSIIKNKFVLFDELNYLL